MDHGSGLIWQLGDCAGYMTYDHGEKRIEVLNPKCCAGCHDWRLPQPEETMSLLHPKQLNDDF